MELRETFIDLHGLLINQAKNQVMTAIRNIRRIDLPVQENPDIQARSRDPKGRRHVLKIISGKGIHSDLQFPIIKESILDLLEAQSIPYKIDDNNEGVICAYPLALKSFQSSNLTESMTTSFQNTSRSNFKPLSTGSKAWSKQKNWAEHFAKNKKFK